MNVNGHAKLPHEKNAAVNSAKLLGGDLQPGTTFFIFPEFHTLRRAASYFSSVCLSAIRCSSFGAKSLI
jgi:hypothetical protein